LIEAFQWGNVRDIGGINPMSDKKPKKETKEGIDFGIDLGGIFEGIGNLISSVSNITEQSEGGFDKSGEIKGLGDKAKGVYGFTVRTMAGGEQKVEPFGNIRKTPKGPVIKEEREPIADVFDEKNHILVVVELPGMDEDGIELDIENELISLSARRGDRKFKKDITLPCTVDSASVQKSYKNGILELKFNKKI